MDVFGLHLGKSDASDFPFLLYAALFAQLHAHFDLPMCNVPAKLLLMAAQIICIAVVQVLMTILISAKKSKYLTKMENYTVNIKCLALLTRQPLRMQEKSQSFQTSSKWSISGQLDLQQLHINITFCVLTNRTRLIEYVVIDLSASYLYDVQIRSTCARVAHFHSTQ